MSDSEQTQTDGGHDVFLPTSSPNYVRVAKDAGSLPKTGQVVKTSSREQQHTNHSQQQDNGNAKLVTGATVQEDEAHRQLRREILGRLNEMKKGVENQTDAQYKAWQESQADPTMPVSPVEPMSRQQTIDYYNGEIQKYQNGYPVYTGMDNLKNVAMAPVRLAQGIWGLAKGVGNTAIDLAKGGAAGEMMQSTDPEVSAAGQKLAKEAGDSLAERGKNAGKAVIFALPQMAKQASDGDWGTPVGDTAMGMGAGKVATLAGGALKAAGRAGAVAEEGGGAAAVAEEGGGAAAVVGEPVSVATGEYLETWQDFLVPGTFSFNGDRYMGLQLPLPQHYVSPLGSCQISMFDEIFSNPEPGQLLFHTADGKTIRFDRPFNFLPSTNAAYPHLELKAPWLRQLKLKDRGVFKTFRQYDDDVYRLEQIEDLNGNVLAFRRDDDGLLDAVDGPDGLSLAFDNDASGRRLQIVLTGTDGSQLLLARYAYDGAGRMVSADCAFGMSVRYVWLASIDLLRSWHNITRQSETRFTYDDVGRVIHTQTSGIWNGDRFEYGDGATRYLPGGSDRTAQSFEFDLHKNVTAEIDALGGAVRYTYDDSGFHISTTDANGNSSRTRYDVRGNVKEATDAEGRTTTYGWGDDGELMIVIDGAGNRRTFAHDDKANVVAETDAEGHVTRLVRDSLGHVVEAHFPNGSIEQRSWDRYNRLEAVTDAAGNTTRFEYDAFNRLTVTTLPNGTASRQSYQAGAGGFDTVSAIVRPDGVQIARSFDGSGHLATVRDGEGRTWGYQCGAFGVLKTITDPKGGSLTFETDVEGRITSLTNATGRVYSFERDRAGRVVVEEDFDGRVRRYEYDAAGQIVEVLKHDGARLRYDYDKSGLVRRIESFDAKGEEEDVNRFWYDGRALLIRAENKAALVELRRDRNGRVIGETLNGKRIRSERDALGNRVRREIVGPGQALTHYIRDPLGLVEKMVSGDAEMSFSRDSLGREKDRRMGRFRLQQRFDSADQLTVQLAGAESQSGVDLSRLGWNVPGASPDQGAGPRALAGRPAQVRRVYEYDRAFSPVAIDDGQWGERRLSYDDNGQLTDAEAAFGSERFRYDEARNLVGASSSVDPVAAAPSPYGHAFDEAFGSVVPAGAPRGWNTTAGGVVQLARGPRGERVQLVHDACGRLTERRVERDGFRLQRWRYRWDAYDRLVGAVAVDGDEWLFRYDPFGRRVSKVRRLKGEEKDRIGRMWPSLASPDGVPARMRTTEGIRTTSDETPPVVGTAYLWDGDLMVAEAPLSLDGHVDWQAAVHWHFEERTHRLVAKQLASGEMLAVVCDHLGTPKEMFDGQGDIVWAADHHVWGAIRLARTWGALAVAPSYQHAPEELQCPWRFQGQYEDADTGLYYNRHRYFDPLTGQYACPDPIGLIGGDRPQAYVQNPMVWTDPLGLDARATYQRPAPTAPANWNTARKQYWRSAYQRETANPSGKYSAENLLRMKAGDAPMMTIVVKSRKTGQLVTRDVQVELHHQQLPQRLGTARVNEPWNLTEATPWGHEAMDPYRHTGYDLVRIINGPNSWPGTP